MTEPTTWQDDQTPPDLVRVPVPQEASAVAQARRTVRSVLLVWNVPALIDTVVLAASELITNALRYGRPPVYVELRRSASTVALDVHDDNPAGFDLGPAGHDAEGESGRGLHIVQALADEVVCQQVPGDGKLVRAVFSVPA